MIKFIIALLLFLPTTAFVGTYAYLLFIPIAWMTNKDEIVAFLISFKKTPFGAKYLRMAWLPVLILIAILVNSLYGGASLQSIAMGPLLLFPLTLLCGLVIADSKVLRYLMLFISIEILLGALEYAFGVNSFFYWLPKYYAFVDYESFYHTRVFGLSDNSSYLAQKVVVGFILMFFVPLQLKTKELLLLVGVLLLGLILTFGRTAIVAVFVATFLYLVAYAVAWIAKRQVFYVNPSKKLLVIMSGFIVFVAATFSFWVHQFTRLAMLPRFLDASEEAEFLRNMGLGNLEMAGRRELWIKALHFIQDNLVFGNFSQRFEVDGKHVHNSMLEYLATHGLLITLIMVVFITVNLRKSNLFIVGAIAIYSVGQFGIFWDISFLDVIFFGLLLFGHKLLTQSEDDPFRSH